MVPSAEAGSTFACFLFIVFHILEGPDGCVSGANLSAVPPFRCITRPGCGPSPYRAVRIWDLVRTRCADHVTVTLVVDYAQLSFVQSISKTRRESAAGRLL